MARTDPQANKEGMSVAQTDPRDERKKERKRRRTEREREKGGPPRERDRRGQAYL